MCGEFSNFTWAVKEAIALDDPPTDGLIETRIEGGPLANLVTRRLELTALTAGAQQYLPKLIGILRAASQTASAQTISSQM